MAFFDSGKKVALALGSILTVTTAAVMGAGMSETELPASVKRCDCECSCDYCLSGQCDFKRVIVDAAL